MPNFDFDSYQAGMYHEAISRVAAFSPAESLTVPQLTRLLHALIAAAMIASPKSDAKPRPGIEIDNINRVALVNGRPVHLERLQFEILAFLDSKKPNLCSYQEIFACVYKEPYRGDKPQQTKLHKAMVGLRDSIGDGWIETVRGSGFRITGTNEDNLQTISQI